MFLSPHFSVHQLRNWSGLRVVQNKVENGDVEKFRQTLKPAVNVSSALELMIDSRNLHIIAFNQSHSSFTSMIEIHQKLKNM